LSNARCPLCSDHAAPYAEIPPRRYFSCACCGLVFLDKDQLPTTEEERAEYDLHENDPYDAGYRTFLSRLTTPLVDGIETGAEGLDFGCGPGPAIAVMLEEMGFHVANYDPFYAPDETVLDRDYDFISCTEVVEHFHAPADEFARLATLLRPDGRLGVMTRLLLPETDFATWYYARQPSHVAFYRPETMHWIADRFGWVADVKRPDVILFESPDLIRSP